MMGWDQEKAEAVQQERLAVEEKKLAEQQREIREDLRRQEERQAAQHDVKVVEDEFGKGALATSHKAARGESAEKPAAKAVGTSEKKVHSRKGGASAAADNKAKVVKAAVSGILDVKTTPAAPAIDYAEKRAQAEERKAAEVSVMGQGAGCARQENLYIEDAD